MKSSGDPLAHIRAINRPYEPDAKTCAFIYEAYLLLRRAPPTFGAWARQGAFEFVAAHAYSWRVIGITESAIKQIAKTGTGEGLRRGHWFERKHRYAQLFGEGSKEMSQDELVKFFYEHDTTIVMLKEDNNGKQDPSRWGNIIPIPDEGLFLTSGYKFTVRKGTELPWVKRTVAKLFASP